MGGKKFDLLGKNIVWNEATDRYNSLRAEYYLMSQEAEKLARELFEEKITSVNALRDSSKSLYDKLFKVYLKKSVWKLVEFEIYDIDEEVLLGIVETYTELKYKLALQSVTEQIFGIDGNVMKQNMERKENVDSILGFGKDAGSDLVDQWLNGGVKDFTPVLAGAGSLVAAGGVALYNNHQNKCAQAEAVEAKKRVFESKSNRENIFISFSYDVFALYETMGRIINSRLEDHNYYYYPSDEDLGAIEPICRNVFEGNFNHLSDKPDLEREMIYRILQTNPYDNRIYSHILLKNGTITEELKTILVYLNIDMKMLADAYLYEKYSIDEYDTYEMMCDFEKIVLDELKLFGINGCSFYIDVVNKKQNLFELRCTFNGFVYSSIEERDKAEEQYNSFFEKDRIIEDLSLDEAIEKYYATLLPQIYPKNREDIQYLLMIHISNCLNTIPTSELVEPYIVDAEQKRIAYQFEELSLIIELTKYKKKLETKEKMAATVAMAKEKASIVAGAAKDKAGAVAGAAKDKAGMAADKAGAVAGMAKDKGKELMSKMPFGKKDKLAIENIPPQPEVIEMKNCVQCGNALKITAKFCGKCGYRF